jgi:hypothetical protein
VLNINASAILPTTLPPPTKTLNTAPGHTFRSTIGEAFRVVQGNVVLASFSWTDAPISGTEARDLKRLLSWNVGVGLLYKDPWNFFAPQEPHTFGQVVIQGALVHSPAKLIPCQFIQTCPAYFPTPTRTSTFRPTPYLIGGTYKQGSFTYPLANPEEFISNPPGSLLPDQLLENSFSDPIPRAPLVAEFSFYTPVKLVSFTIRSTTKGSEIQYSNKEDQFLLSMVLEEVQPLTSEPLMSYRIINEPLLAEGGGPG